MFCYRKTAFSRYTDPPICIINWVMLILLSKMSKKVYKIQEFRNDWATSESLFAGRVSQGSL